VHHRNHPGLALHALLASTQMTHPKMQSPLTSIIQLWREREGFQNISDYRAALGAGQTKKRQKPLPKSKNLEHLHPSIRFLDNPIPI
jgi:hypothetical protein